MAKARILGSGWHGHSYGHSIARKKGKWLGAKRNVFVKKDSKTITVYPFEDRRFHYNEKKEIETRRTPRHSNNTNHTSRNGRRTKRTRKTKSNESI